MKRHKKAGRKVPMVNKWTPKLEKFCHAIVSGKAVDQSDAYRIAFRVAPTTKAKTVHEKASRLMADAKIKARIAELLQAVIKDVQVTRLEWLKKMERFFHADVRKMFDSHGNPIEIPQLSDAEAALIEGFEVIEDFTKVKNAAGATESVPTGYTKKYKLTPPLKAMLEFGKVMGFYKEKIEVEHTTMEELVLGSMESEQKP